MTSVFHLYQLQKVDSQVSVNNSRIGQIEVILANDIEVRATKAALDEKERVLSDLNRELKTLEERIQARRNKMEQSESSLYGGSVKNPKELQDLQKEIISLRANIAELEEEQLNLLIQIEAAEEEVNCSTRTYKKSAEDFEKNHQTLITEETELEDKNARLAEEREVIVAQIKPDLLVHYTVLREKKKGIAISKIAEQSCGICGSTLTPAECQTVKTQVKIVECPACGRILYAD